ncbi:EF-Hand 1, calcium-binding site,EF-hand domain pair,EF-hand domain [Cinara cedri]|uniref:EF-Hand 1, calcium-binding site,EF-hand domain pair,EF-hand domain n=1 Tax=Cinara cedri TaxID=506608 RepID=A0A5E4M0X6_9HEMI|nr:EF-Hand 1, calcium-binding site,EF-hand domain pair,EF-hand domain [Cinara cedri]
MSSISQFRKNKLMYVFNVFFDVNASGTIDKKDFEIAIERFCNLRGWSGNPEKEEKTRSCLLKVWDGLQSGADKDQDGQVTQDEWCAMWDDFSKNPSAPQEWQTHYMNFMFDLVDTSGDGSIDEAEFCEVCQNNGVPAAEAADAYKRFSKNGTIQVSHDEFAKYWVEFFASEDPAALGNFIFGKTSFD